MKERIGGLGMRNIVYRILSLVMVLVLISGCGVLGLGGPEPVEIRFAYLDQMADYQPLADQFHEEHPHITVVLDPVPLAGQPVRELISRSREADAIRIFTTEVSDDLAQTFLPLDGMISTDEHISQDDFFNGSLEGLKLDGKLLGLPAALNPLVVHYLPEKFAFAGVAVPPPTWTIDDFVTTAMAVHNVDDALIGTQGYTYGWCSHPQLPDLAMFTYLFGGGLFDNDILRPMPTLNRIENVQALAWYASLANDFGLMPPGDPARGLYPMLYNRACGFWVHFMVGSILGDEQIEGTSILPMPTYVSTFNIATLDGYFVMASSEHPEETYQWISFLMAERSAAGSMIPPLKSIIASEEYALTAPPDVLAVARSLPERTMILGLETFRSSGFNNGLQFFGKAVQRVIEEGADPQIALDEAQLQAESSMP